MKERIATLFTGVHVKKLGVLLVATFLITAVSVRAGSQTPSNSAASNQTTSNSVSSNDDEVHYDPVKITNGPVVENVTDATAIIAWSTNVNAGTLLRYGPNPDNLVLTASMPWGGITHRVHLKGLTPGTKYYFQAQSGEGQGTGTSATAELKMFQTK